MWEKVGTQVTNGALLDSVLKVFNPFKADVDALYNLMVFNGHLSHPGHCLASVCSERYRFLLTKLLYRKSMQMTVNELYFLLRHNIWLV